MDSEQLWWIRSTRPPYMLRMCESPMRWRDVTGEEKTVSICRRSKSMEGGKVRRTGGGWEDCVDS